MSMLDQLKQYEVRRYDYRTGTLRDLSPNAVATDPTATACLWNTSEKGRNLRIKSATSRLDFGATDSLGTGNITIIALVKPDSIGATNGMIINNGKTLFGMGANKFTAASDGATYIYSAASSVVYGQDYVGAITRTSAGVTNFFVNGTQSGTRNQSSGTPAGATTNVFVGNRNGNDRNFDGSIYYLAIYNTILTEQQISQISDELMNEKTVTIPSIQSDSKGVNLCCDGNMERADTDFWTPNNDAVLTKQTGTPNKGIRCFRIGWGGTANPFCQQSSILAAKKFYRITGVARGTGGTAYPRIYNNAGSTILWQGTTSAAWQPFDFNFQPATAELRLTSITASDDYVEFDDIKIVEVPSLTSYDAIPKKAYIDNGGIGWNRSFANETTGELSNTGWRIYSGTWQVKNQGDADETKKQIVCVGSGIIYRYAPFAYGTWKWDVYKGGAVTQPEFMPFATNFNKSQKEKRNDKKCE